MCGGFRIDGDAEALAAFFDARLGQLELPLNAERFPGQPAPIVIGVEPPQGAPHARLGPARWGLVPRWARSPEIGRKLYNARCETLPEKPSFREAFARRRCVVPVSVFYEWEKLAGGGSRRHGYGPADGTPWLGLAGLWESWRAPRGVPLTTFTVVTCEANELVGAVHPRMPVVLPREHFRVWLTPGPLPAEVARAVCVPCPVRWLAERPS